MPLQNRVQPTGEILAVPARGAYMGNRGILHDDAKHLTSARWRHKAWVTCVLSFKQRKRSLMTPGRYTELFFADEAVAFAAGHRPCGECRRADYNRFRQYAGITGKITDYDAQLHHARAVPRTYGQVRHAADVSELPDGTFILDADGMACLVLGEALVPYQAHSGYGERRARPTKGRVTVLTPIILVDVLRAGYELDLRLNS